MTLQDIQLAIDEHRFDDIVNDSDFWAKISTSNSPLIPNSDFIIFMAQDHQEYKRREFDYVTINILQNRKYKLQPQDWIVWAKFIVENIDYISNNYRDEYGSRSIFMTATFVMIKEMPIEDILNVLLPYAQTLKRVDSYYFGRLVDFKKYNLTPDVWSKLSQKSKIEAKNLAKSTDKWIGISNYITIMGKQYIIDNMFTSMFYRYIDEWHEAIPEDELYDILYKYKSDSDVINVIRRLPYYYDNLDSISDKSINRLIKASKDFVIEMYVTEDGASVMTTEQFRKLVDARAITSSSAWEILTKDGSIETYIERVGEDRAVPELRGLSITYDSFIREETIRKYPSMLRPQSIKYNFHSYISKDTMKLINAEARRRNEKNARWH